MKTQILLGGAMLFALTATACVTTSPDTKVMQDAVHFPVRTVSDIDAAKVTTFRADTVIENNCVYAVNVTGKSPTRRYVLTWPKGSKMEFMGRKLEVVSAAAGTGATNRSVLNVGERSQITGVIKEEPYRYRAGYHAKTAERDCKSSGIIRAVSWKKG